MTTMYSPLLPHKSTTFNNVNKPELEKKILNNNNNPSIWSTFLKSKWSSVNNASSTTTQRARPVSMAYVGTSYRNDNNTSEKHESWMDRPNRINRHSKPRPPPPPPPPNNNKFMSSTERGVKRVKSESFSSSTQEGNYQNMDHLPVIPPPIPKTIPPPTTSNQQSEKTKIPPIPPPRKLKSVSVNTNNTTSNGAIPKTSPPSFHHKQDSNTRGAGTDTTDNDTENRIPSSNNKNIPLKTTTAKQDDKTSEKPISTHKPIPESFAQLFNKGNQTYYELLGIEITSDKRTITKAFRKLCLIYHPDHNKTSTANEDFHALKHVYDVLAGSSSRMAYNSRLRVATGKSKSNPSTNVQV
jgi:hypothetical protein